MTNRLVHHPQLVVTCDKSGVPLDTVEKMAAHREGVRHLAVSVFLFTGNSEMLLQQRAHAKYHSGGLWSNSACTHPMPNETMADAATRAVKVELGTAAHLSPAFVAQYDLDVGQAMHENEYTQVFVGHCPLGACDADAREVQALKTSALDDIRDDAIANPERYTPWLRYIMGKHFDELVTAMKRLEREEQAKAGVF